MFKKPFAFFGACLLGLPTFLLAIPFKYFNPADTAAVPKLLSQTGIYTNTITKTLDTAAKYFDVNSALWSDDAAKTRWIILPKGKKIPYNDTTDFFDYPDSTVFVKTFKLDKVEGDTSSASRVFWETRLLLKKVSPKNDTDWYGFSYKWRADQSDADLVSLKKGLDTLFYYTTKEKKTSYKKWSFPSQESCLLCHRIGVKPGNDPVPLRGRAALGFFPAQLKRPSPLTPNTNQVIDLFNRGVFSGTQPDAAALARRFKSVRDPIPSGLTPDQRFAVIDTMVRSYLSANCSSCHGSRGMAVRSTAQASVDFDWHNFKPQSEMSMRPVTALALRDQEPFNPQGTVPPRPRALMTMIANQWGFKTGPGELMDMTLPPADTASVLVYPGYPAQSGILYRTWIRNYAQIDSINVGIALRWNMGGSEAAYFTSLNSWLFTKSWGSQEWFDLINARGFKVQDIFVRPKVDKGDYSIDLYSNSAAQMPRVATFLPDTAALKIMAEWVKNYRILTPVGIANPPKSAKNSPQSTFQPLIRGRLLYVPVGWKGRATMVDVGGRIHTLIQKDSFVFTLPPSISAGIYQFRVGEHSFMSSVL
jgi:hypothetical protein